MAKKQGFQYKADPFVYQELENGTSMALGMDQSDDDKLKVVTQLTPGASPSLGNENIIIDPSANGNIELLPNGTGSIETDSNISFIGGTSGITFDGGTNVLDFYETGTWTPTLQFGGGSTGITYTIQSGSYTRIGNIIYAGFSITLSSKGTSTGQATLSLPFPNAAITEGVGSIFFSSLTFTSSYVIARIPATTSVIIFQGVNSGGGGSNITNTSFVDTTTMRGSIVYLI